MSNPGQVVSGVVGGAIGFVIGGPAGALYGLQLGVLAGSIISPTQLPGVQGPRVKDFEAINADPGWVIPKGWGTFAIERPGVLYLGPGKTTSTTETVSAKGAPEQEVETFTSTQTLVLGLCEYAPNLWPLRIWENGKLVYDVRPRQPYESGANSTPLDNDDVAILSANWAAIHLAASFEDIAWEAIGFPGGMPLSAGAAAIMSQWWTTIQAAGSFESVDWVALGYATFGERATMSQEYAETFVYYSGSEDDLPDPTMELEIGAGKVPGYRGYARLVYPNRLIKAEQGNRHPMFKVEMSTEILPLNLGPTGPIIHLETTAQFDFAPGSYTHVHAVPAGSGNRVAIVVFLFPAPIGEDTLSAITYGGVNMTILGAASVEAFGQPPAVAIAALHMSSNPASQVLSFEAGQYGAYRIFFFDHVASLTPSDSDVVNDATVGANNPLTLDPLAVVPGNLIFGVAAKLDQADSPLLFAANYGKATLYFDTHATLAGNELFLEASIQWSVGASGSQVLSWSTEDPNAFADECAIGLVLAQAS